jgi:hypothetical protein
VALLIGSVMSFAGVLMAAQAGETSALRLHAAELLMMLGTVIVMLIERPAPPQADGRLHAERRAACSAASV